MNEKKDEENATQSSTKGDRKIIAHFDVDLLEDGNVSVSGPMNDLLATMDVMVKALKAIVDLHFKSRYKQEQGIVTGIDAMTLMDKLKSKH